MKRSIPYLICVTSLLGIIACQKSPESVQFETPVSTVEELSAHTHEFRKEVIEVTEGVHVAVGYGLANSILIEGADGVIIVDCLESRETAAKVKAEFDKITDKPVKAIIYTHNHTDHIMGASAMAGADQPEIYAHELTTYYIDRMLSVVREVLEKRSFRMFGNFLDEESLVNAGIGPCLDIHAHSSFGILRPTITFEDKLDVTIADVKIQLVHAPGETNDQLFVWLPEKKVLLPGDNLYKTFPNLYTIRGTPYRDVIGWAKSLDKMRYLHPEYLVPSHTRPLIGSDTIQNVLTTYRDAIQYIHDQTIRNMNLGLTPDEIVEIVKLPPHLSNSPFLQEFYGRADWSVRAVFDGYLGWFDGNPSTLLPLTQKDKANKMARLAGGSDQLLEQAKNALSNQEYQWALELTDELLLLMPDNEEVINTRYQSLIALGEAQSNPNARHYYLTSALELKGLEIKDVVEKTPEVVHSIPLASIFNALPTNLVPAKSININKKAVFHFTDAEEVWSVHVRNGVAEVQPFALESPDFEVTMEANTWKEMTAQIKGGLSAYMSGDLKVEGGISAFSDFMDLFKK